MKSASTPLLAATLLSLTAPAWAEESKRAVEIRSTVEVLESAAEVDDIISRIETRKTEREDSRRSSDPRATEERRPNETKVERRARPTDPERAAKVRDETLARDGTSTLSEPKTLTTSTTERTEVPVKERTDDTQIGSKETTRTR
jgi:hypothetical protein